MRTHIPHILLKLNLRDLVQPVVLAHEMKLLESGFAAGSAWVG